LKNSSQDLIDPDFIFIRIIIAVNIVQPDGHGFKPDKKYEHSGFGKAGWQNILDFPEFTSGIFHEKQARTNRAPDTAEIFFPFAVQNTESSCREYKPVFFPDSLTMLRQWKW